MRGVPLMPLCPLRLLKWYTMVYALTMEARLLVLLCCEHTCPSCPAMMSCLT